MPNVLSPRDLVSRPDKMDNTVLHTQLMCDFDLVYAKTGFLMKLTFLHFRTLEWTFLEKGSKSVIDLDIEQDSGSIL